MTKEKEYLILAFKTTSDAMQAEKYLKKSFAIAVMPVPREISSGCGLAIRFLNPEITEVKNFLKTSPLNFTLYKMNTKKVNGTRPVEILDVSR